MIYQTYLVAAVRRAYLLLFASQIQRHVFHYTCSNRRRRRFFSLRTGAVVDVQVVQIQFSLAEAGQHAPADHDAWCSVGMLHALEGQRRPVEEIAMCVRVRVPPIYLTKLVSSTCLSYGIRDAYARYDLANVK